MTDTLILLEKTARDAKELGVLSKRAREACGSFGRLAIATSPLHENGNGSVSAKIRPPDPAALDSARSLSGMWAQNLLNLRALCQQAYAEADAALAAVRPELEGLGIKFTEGT